MSAGNRETLTFDNFAIANDQVVGYGKKFSIQGLVFDDTVTFSQKFEFSEIEFRGNINPE